MAHKRARSALGPLKKLGSFWPVVGVLGLRQVGKTTLLRDIFGLKNFVSLDDEEIRDEAQQSAKNFLAKLSAPVVIDEAQKAASLFDAIKLKVDQRKVPGSYYLTGSTTFSSKLGIQESLTGRIGLLQLLPLTLSEIYQKEFIPLHPTLIHNRKLRFKTEDVIRHLAVGGLPVPVFTRDVEQRNLYFKNWLETTIVRDVARLYGRGYDLDISWSILRQFGKMLQNGELPTLRQFTQNSRVLRKYLSALEGVFVIRKFPCHELGVGEDCWIFTDSGVARSIIGTEYGQGVTLSLARSFLINEILAGFEYSGKSFHPSYYKSARGTPVDFVASDTAIKITTETKAGLSYEERALAGAMKKLGISYGLLAAPVDQFVPPKKGIAVIPWSFWS